MEFVQIRGGWGFKGLSIKIFSSKIFFKILESGKQILVLIGHWQRKRVQSDEK